MSTAEMVLLLCAVHFVADFPLQGDFVAKFKNRHAPDTGMGVVWPWCLTAHAAAHGLAVGVVTGSVALGLAEFFVHWAIDFGKCEGWFNFHVDQGAHLSCKILWTALL